MATSAILVIVVAAGEASSTATGGLLAAAESALATGTSVRVVEVSYPSDGAALRIEDELEARASVAIVWEDAAHLQARIRLHVAQTDRWTDRLIKFSPADGARERGRTLGLAMVTMWPEGAALRRAPAAAAPRPPPAPAPGPSAAADAPRPRVAATPPIATAARADMTPRGESGRAEAAEPEGTEAADAPARAPAAAVVEPAERVRATPREPPGAPLSRHGVELAAVASSGVMGAATGYGGLLDGALFLAPALSLRAAIALRVGSIPDLPGSDVVASVGGGLEWWPLATSSTRRLGLGLRAGALLIRHQVFATTTAGGTESYGRFVPAAELIPLLAFAVSKDVEILLGLGAEVAFGATEIRRGPELERVASIPPVRVVAQTGVRFRF